MLKTGPCAGGSPPGWRHIAARTRHLTLRCRFGRGDVGPAVVGATASGGAPKHVAYAGGRGGGAPEHAACEWLSPGEHALFTLERAGCVPQSDRLGKKAFGALLVLHHMPTVLVQIEKNTLMKSTLMK